MSTWRKKPLQVEAFKWTGGHDQPEDPTWIVDAIKVGLVRFTLPGVHGPTMSIDTIEGTMSAKPGDYIIQGIKGEIYPCKADIFEASYELVSE